MLGNFAADEMPYLTADVMADSEWYLNWMALAVICGSSKLNPT